MKNRPTIENTPLPADLDAENTLLATCFFDRADAEDIAGRCRPEYFTTDRTRRTFEAIRRLVDAGKPIDATLLFSELRTACNLDPEADAVFISRLMDLTPITGDIEHHAKLVSDAFRRRQIIRAANDATTAALMPNRETEKTLLKLQTDIFNLDADGGAADPVRPFSELVDEAGETIEGIKTRGVKPGIRSNLFDVDRVLNGFQPSGLYILAARPGMGKTALALRFALNAAKSGNPVAFMSLEMSKEALTLRAICAESCLPFNRVFSGDLDNEKDWARFVDAQGHIWSLPLFIDDTGALHYQEIARRLRRLKRLHGIKFAVVDYLQLAHGDKGDGRTVEVGTISHGLKAIAKELDIPILALCQLNRQCEQRTNKRPVLSDIRESGDIENDADAVMSLYNDKYYNEKSEAKPELIVLKQRNGKIGAFCLDWDPASMNFSDYIKGAEK